MVDYSLTNNKFIHLDGYLLPSIDPFIRKIAKFKVFSHVDIKRAYHQIRQTVIQNLSGWRANSISLNAYVSVQLMKWLAIRVLFR